MKGGGEGPGGLGGCKKLRQARVRLGGGDQRKRVKKNPKFEGREKRQESLFYARVISVHRNAPRSLRRIGDCIGRLVRSTHFRNAAEKGGTHKISATEVKGEEGCRLKRGIRFWGFFR